VQYKLLLQRRSTIASKIQTTTTICSKCSSRENNRSRASVSNVQRNLFLIDLFVYTRCLRKILLCCSLFSFFGPKTSLRLTVWHKNFMRGSQHSSYYREPWVIKLLSISTEFPAIKKYAPTNSRKFHLNHHTSATRGFYLGREPTLCWSSSTELLPAAFLGRFFFLSTAAKIWFEARFTCLQERVMRVEKYIRKVDEKK